MGDVLYTNITIVHPTQWAIWIGPQQAGYRGACSLLWPELEPIAKCPSPAEITFRNITLRDVLVIDPNTSPGVILGNSTNPMLNLTFDNVTVVKPGEYPWGHDYYDCKGVLHGKAVSGTWPVPPCFDQ